MKIAVTIEFNDNARKLIARSSDAVHSSPLRLGRRANRAECLWFIHSAMIERRVLAEADIWHGYPGSGYVENVVIHVRGK